MHLQSANYLGLLTAGIFSCGINRLWEASFILVNRGKLRYEASATPNCIRCVGRTSAIVPAKNSSPSPKHKIY